MKTDEIAYDVFLSYHWGDHASVEAVASALIERGLNTFLDRWYLTPGLPWDALQASLGRASAAVIFIGPEGLGGSNGKLRWPSTARRMNSPSR